VWREYHLVRSIEEALHILAEQGSRARLVAGATDLVLEMERGGRKDVETLIDISRIPDLDQIRHQADGLIHLGALVTHNHCVASNILAESGLPLSQAAWQVGSPQIRNRGTVAGNLITGSPANDTIPPLMALGAKVSLRSKSGERTVSLESLYTGVRRTIIRPDEMLVDISFPALETSEDSPTGKQRGIFIKMGLRKAQAISVVNTAIVLTFDRNYVEKAVITLGSVAPTVIHAKESESYLQGKQLSEETIQQCSDLAAQAARPIDDTRGSAVYRHEAVRVCVLRGLRALAESKTSISFLPQEAPLLWGKQVDTDFDASAHFSTGNPQPIVTRINDKEYTFTSGHHKTLLNLLREEGGLTGSKEGCGEGECGACTIFLDGAAVMGCLVPAPRAHHAEIVTIEGLAKNGKLHPVQEAFIEDGAVQCGFCTPGFVMSAAKLLEEKPSPNRWQIQQAITGNLCRCTGYYKIIEAIEHAAISASGR